MISIPYNFLHHAWLLAGAGLNEHCCNIRSLIVAAAGLYENHVFVFRLDMQPI